MKHFSWFCACCSYVNLSIIAINIRTTRSTTVAFPSPAPSLVSQTYKSPAPQTSTEEPPLTTHLSEGTCCNGDNCEKHWCGSVGCHCGGAVSCVINNITVHGCGYNSNNSTKPCTCSHDCIRRQDCCSDYSTVCSDYANTTTSELITEPNTGTVTKSQVPSSLTQVAGGVTFETTITILSASQSGQMMAMRQAILIKIVT